MPLSPQNDDELRQFVLQQLRGSDLSTLVRQLQGDAATAVLRLLVPGTKRRVTFGSSTCTWTASADSATTTIAHGLGVTPVWEDAFPVATGALQYSLSSKDATNIVIVGRDTRNTALTGTFGFDWVAVG